MKMMNFSTMIEPIVSILNKSQSIMTNREIDEEVFHYLHIDETYLLRKHKNSNQSEFSYRCAWARTYLKKYGIIQNIDRGLWKISDTYNGEDHIDADAVIEAVVNKRIYVPTVIELENNNVLSNDHIKVLSEKYAKNKITLFLGAGVSMAANMPSWDTLVARFLVHRFKEESKDSMDEKTLMELVEFEKVNRETSLIAQTRFIKQNIEPKKYFELLIESLYQDEDKIKLDNELLNALTKMIRNKNMIRIKHIITFNFDNLLERKLEQKDIYFHSYDGYGEESDREAVNIYHVHGYLHRDLEPDQIGLDNIIFSEEQYHRMYGDSFNWSNMKQVSALRENTCLFIGCSLSDPNMRRLLDIARVDNEAKHYAILQKEKIINPNNISTNCKSYELYQEFRTTNQDSYFKSLGINVVWFETFDEVPSILNEIMKEA